MKRLFFLYIFKNFYKNNIMLMNETVDFKFLCSKIRRIYSYFIARSNIVLLRRKNNMKFRQYLQIFIRTNFVAHKIVKVSLMRTTMWDLISFSRE